MYISDRHLGILPCPHCHTSVPLPMLVPCCLLLHAGLIGLPWPPLSLKPSPKEAAATVAAHGWGVGKAKQGGKSGWLFFPRTRQREPGALGNGHPWRAGDLPRVTQQPAAEAFSPSYTVERKTNQDSRYGEPPIGDCTPGNLSWKYTSPWVK